MRSYLCVALTVLVLAADHTLADKNHVLPFTFYDNSNLEWQWFSGSLPEKAVGIWNYNTKRWDYVCRTYDGCEPGYYHKGSGPYCFYATYPRLSIAVSFYVLVNKDGFEFLEWKWGSHGSVPKKSVRTCTCSTKDYVGKNKYGLGLVHAGDSFYLPWFTSRRGDKFVGYTEWYRESYEVLTINADGYKQVIKYFKYDLGRISIIKTPPFAVYERTVTNKGCNEASMTVNLYSTQTKTNTWKFSYSMKLATSTTVTAGIPIIVEASVHTIGVEESFQTSQRTSMTTYKPLNNIIQRDFTVPPNKKCTVKMQGRTFTSDIPFEARLGRTYSNGETKWTTISGTYKGVQVADHGAVIDRCEPLADPFPCGD